MDPKFQSTFIPKQPTVGGSPARAPRQRRSEKASLVNMIVIGAFVVVLVIAGGAFGYTRYLNNTIAEKGIELKAEVDSLNPAEINSLATADAQLRQAQDILKDHLVPSRLFEYLEGVTLQNVQFVDFSYTAQPGARPIISMAGIADRYETVALQADKFGQENDITSATFSGLNQAEDGGVAFFVEAQLSSRLTSYSR